MLLPTGGEDATMEIKELFGVPLPYTIVRKTCIMHIANVGAYLRSLMTQFHGDALMLVSNYNLITIL